MEKLILTKLNGFSERALLHKGYKVPVIVDSPITSKAARSRSIETDQKHEHGNDTLRKHDLYGGEQNNFTATAAGESVQVEGRLLRSQRSARSAHGKQSSKLSRFFSKVSSLITKITPKKTNAQNVEVLDHSPIVETPAASDRDFSNALDESNLSPTQLHPAYTRKPSEVAPFRISKDGETFLKMQLIEDSEGSMDLLRARRSSK